MNKNLMALSVALALVATPVLAADKAKAGAAAPAAAAASAEAPTATADAEKVQALLDKVKADKKLITVTALDLTDAESKAFWPVYNQYQEGLAKINKRLGKLVLDYAAAFTSGTLTDKEASRLLHESLAVDEDELKLRKSQAQKVSKVLPGIKAARYMQLENKIRLTLKAQLAAELPLAE